MNQILCKYNGYKILKDKMLNKYLLKKNNFAEILEKN